MIINNIEFNLIRKKVKNLRITIKSDNTINVSIPFFMQQKKVYDFINSKMKTIEKQIEKNLNKNEYKISYENGEKIFLWGKTYTLFIKTGKKNICAFDNANNINLYLVKNHKTGTKEKTIKEFYRKEMQRNAKIILTKWEEQTGIECNELRIKDMKTRWGSCNIKDKRIWLNLKLAFFDKECLNYVTLHELMHIKERYHNKKFYGMIEAYLSGWREAKRKLENYRYN